MDFSQHLSQYYSKENKSITWEKSTEARRVYVNTSKATIYAETAFSKEEKHV
jgi:hypothetical protein